MECRCYSISSIVGGGEGGEVELGVGRGGNGLLFLPQCLCLSPAFFLSRSFHFLIGFLPIS